MFSSDLHNLRFYTHTPILLLLLTNSFYAHPIQLIKNSWSTFWGDMGYIKIARNKKNHCGVASASAYPDMDNM